MSDVRVLVATSALQGARSDDVCTAIEGELVIPNPQPCDGPWCECRRLVVGLGSAGRTTTMRVAEREDVGRGLLAEMVSAALLERYGVAPGVYPPDELARDCELLVESVVSTAAEFAVGSVLELVAEVDADGLVNVAPGLRERLAF